jgi:[acyl-carrier-protein] S-malonyltransferase
MKMMLIFPGQGSQSPGMGKYLFDNFKSVSLLFDEASDCLKIDMKQLCFNGSDADLALTENTQPALLTVSTATQMVIRKEYGIKPIATAGHSIGEYAALVAADAISFPAALQAVRTRGQAMQSAVPVGQGAMAAVMGLDPAQTEEMCQYAVKESGTGPLSPANFNSPGQIVISGSATTMEWLKTQFDPLKLWGESGPKRVKLIPLQVSAPFHCEMMKPAENKMREVLSKMEFKSSQFPIIQNFTALPETKAEVLRENLIRQVSAPVKWMQSMEKAKKNNWTTMIECGNGKVLQGLLKKIDPSIQVFTTNTLEDLKLIENLVQEKK